VGPAQPGGQDLGGHSITTAEVRIESALAYSWAAASFSLDHPAFSKEEICRHDFPGKLSCALV
jgi:hypothetical protein